VTQSKRLGAERVLMIYRRTANEMPAYEYEYELAKQDAVEFWWLTAPVEIVPDVSGERVGALRCVRMELTAPDAAGRRGVQPVSGSEFEIPVDMIVKATGQSKIKDWLTKTANVETDAAGRVVVNSATMQTTNAKIFAGGDCVNGGREAVDAAQTGKLAAQGIHLSLSGDRVEFAGARVPLHEETQDVKSH
jgi:dihydropyrimidine dehydrogenase (NAD+) subunit PreT